MPFNEDSRVKIPTLLHLMRLGYGYRSLSQIDWDRETNIVRELFFESLKLNLLIKRPVKLKASKHSTLFHFKVN